MIVKCNQIACYNQRNDKECFDVLHTDGRKTAGYTDKTTALSAEKLTRDEALKMYGATHQFRFC